MPASIDTHIHARSWQFYLHLFQLRVYFFFLLYLHKKKFPKYRRFWCQSPFFISTFFSFSFAAAAVEGQNIVFNSLQQTIFRSSFFCSDVMWYTRIKKLVTKRREKRLLFFLSVTQFIRLWNVCVRVFVLCKLREQVYGKKFCISTMCIIAIVILLNRIHAHRHKHTHIHIVLGPSEISSINAEVYLTWPFKLNDLECKWSKREEKKSTHTQARITTNWCRH